MLDISEDRIYLYIYFVWVGVCLLVRLYTIIVKTAEPVGPNFCVGHHMTPGKVYECSELQKLFTNIFENR